MRKYIRTTKSLTELCVFLQRHEDKVTEKGSSFVNQLIFEWDERIIGKKLIEFHEEDLAKQIDGINPNQSKYNICKEIYRIILEPKKVDVPLISEEPSDYHIGESYTNSIEWGVYI